MMFLFLKCNYELTDLNTFESQFKSLASEFFLTRFQQSLLTSLLSGMRKSFRLNLYICCLRPKTSHFSKSSLFLWSQILEIIFLSTTTYNRKIQTYRFYIKIYTLLNSCYLKFLLTLKQQKSSFLLEVLSDHFIYR